MLEMLVAVDEMGGAIVGRRVGNLGGTAGTAVHRRPKRCDRIIHCSGITVPESLDERCDVAGNRVVRSCRCHGLIMVMCRRRLTRNPLRR